MTNIRRGDLDGALAACPEHLPLDEARPEVVGYLHEVAATTPDPETAERARRRASDLLDAAGMIMPAFERPI
jgi:hypothetical protein